MTSVPPSWRRGALAALVAGSLLAGCGGRTHPAAGGAGGTGSANSGSANSGSVNSGAVTGSGSSAGNGGSGGAGDSTGSSNVNGAGSASGSAGIGGEIQIPGAAGSGSGGAGGDGAGGSGVGGSAGGAGGYGAGSGSGATSGSGTGTGQASGGGITFVTPNPNPVAAINQAYYVFMTSISGIDDDFNGGWVTQLQKVAQPAVVSAAEQAAGTLEAAKEHGVGTLTDDQRRLSITGTTATLTDCLDEYDWYVVSDGTSQPDPGVARGFFVGSGTFVEAGGHWLVSSWRSEPTKCKF